MFKDNTLNAKSMANIVTLPDGKCYEDYLIENGFSKLFVDGIDFIYGKNDYLHSKAFLNNWNSLDNSKKYPSESISEELKMLKWLAKKNKIELAPFVANAIIDNYKPEELPSKIIEIFNLLK